MTLKRESTPIAANLIKMIPYLLEYYPTPIARVKGQVWDEVLLKILAKKASLDAAGPF